jgi:hypothetical protein
MSEPFLDDEGRPLAWAEFFARTEAWLDEIYPVDLFGTADRLLCADRSGVDISTGYGPAAVRALRAAVALARKEDPL